MDRTHGIIPVACTLMPDHLWDAAMYGDLTLAELRVLMYITRRVYGHENGKPANISIYQLLHGSVGQNGERLDHGTQLRKPLLLRAMRDLEARDLIVRRRRIAVSARELPSTYRFELPANPGAPKPRRRRRRA